MGCGGKRKNVYRAELKIVGLDRLQDIGVDNVPYSIGYN
jgi:hypothetical protein